MAVVALLLLIACANVASLLLARGAARQREMAVRVSLGAGRFRLLRQGLTESLLLAASGGLLGILLAYWGTGALVRIMASGRERIELQARPDWVVLLFTAGVALLTGVLFGLAPAWRRVRIALRRSSLRDAGRAGETRLRRLFGKSLVVTQVAFSVVLLSAASLFVRHLSNLEHVDLGFHRDHVLLVELNPASSGYDRERLSRAYQELLGRLEAIPGVRSATICAIVPISGVGAMRTATVEGYQAKPGERRFLSENWVAPKYFATLGMPLLMGRDFSFQDQGGPRVAIVNQTLVRYFFGNGNPLGRHITFDGDRPAVRDRGRGGRHEVQGHARTWCCASSTSTCSSRGAISPSSRCGPGGPGGSGGRSAPRGARIAEDRAGGGCQDDGRASGCVDRSGAAHGDAVRAVRRAGGGDRGHRAVRTASYTVARRTNEIGIRMALGATQSAMSRMVLGEALGMVSAGLAVGAPMALWGKSFAASLIQDLPVKSDVPIAFGAVAMMAVALVAAYVPARRAARVEPMEALRYE